MGHLFGLVDPADFALKDGPRNARLRAAVARLRRFILVATGIAALAISPASRALAQENSSAPGTETDVKLLQPAGAGPGNAAYNGNVARRARTGAKARSNAPGRDLGCEERAMKTGFRPRNAMLPTISATTQYLGTQGNGGRVSDGRFVTNDGVHVYRAWGVYHQDLSPGLLMGTGYTRAKAAEAMANAKGRNCAPRSGCDCDEKLLRSGSRAAQVRDRAGRAGPSQTFYGHRLRIWNTRDRPRTAML